MSFCNLLSVFFFFFFFFSSTIWRTGPYFDKRTAGSQHLVQSNWRIWVPNRCGKKTHYTSGWSIDLFLVNFLGWFAEFFHETETKLSHFHYRVKYRAILPFILSQSQATRDSFSNWASESAHPITSWFIYINDVTHGLSIMMTICTSNLQFSIQLHSAISY